MFDDCTVVLNDPRTMDIPNPSWPHHAHVLYRRVDELQAQLTRIEKMLTDYLNSCPHGMAPQNCGVCNPEGH
jgi:hypothetical protein